MMTFWIDEQPLYLCLFFFFFLIAQTFYVYYVFSVQPVHRIFISFHFLQYI